MSGPEKDERETMDRAACFRALFFSTLTSKGITVKSRLSFCLSFFITLMNGQKGFGIHGTISKALLSPI